MCDVSSLAVQLLELSKQLANSGKLFKLTLKTKDINFNFSSQDRDLPPKVVILKKKSPSQKNRDFQRREMFLKNKLDPSSTKNPSEETNTVIIEPPEESLQCDECEYKATFKANLHKHIRNKHKIIPQIDGHIDEETNVNVEEVVKVKDTGRAEILPAGSEPPPKVLHPSMGLGIDPKIQPPDPWGGIMVDYKFKDCVAEIYQII